MNKESIKSAIKIFAVIITLTANWNLRASPIKQSDKPGEIKTIYIAASLTFTDGRPSQIQTLVKNHLEQQGFVISQRIEDADAVTKTGISGKIVVDGDGTEK